MNGLEAITKISERSNSDIIIFFALISVVIVLITIPFLNAYSRAKKEQLELDIKREENILKVIKENTAVNSSLKTLLEENMKGCDSCKKEQLEYFRKLELALNVLIEAIK